MSAAEVFTSQVEADWLNFSRDIMALDAVCVKAVVSVGLMQRGVGDAVDALLKQELEAQGCVFYHMDRELIKQDWGLEVRPPFIYVKAWGYRLQPVRKYTPIPKKSRKKSAKIVDPLPESEVADDQ